jgi:hypothetical protein
MNYLHFIFLLLIPCVSFSHEFELASPEKQTQVIELYTSEGCSSCPPADRWFSSLKSNNRLWIDFIPLAFHVDYWDYIGWKDELAATEHGIRQQVHKVLGNIPSVYTPGVLKSGKEWRTWRYLNVPESDFKAGQLKVKLKNNKLTASFDNIINNPYDFKLNIALLGMAIETKVRAGENKGKTLKHDFVVLNQQMFSAKQPLWNVDIDSSFFDSRFKQLAFVAWVEYEQNPAPIQAVGTIL